jgi:hypothetical protein
VVNDVMASRQTDLVTNVLLAIEDSVMTVGQAKASLVRNAASETIVDHAMTAGRVKIVAHELLARATRTWKPSASKSAICTR